MKRPLLPCLLLLALPALASAEISLDSSQRLVEKVIRHEIDLRQNPAALDPALAAFQKALLAAEPACPEAAVVGLLQAIYYKGSFSGFTRDQKKALFNQGKEAGEKAREKCPQSGPVHYWLAVCWGRWAEEYGKMAAARQGVADKIRDYAEAASRLGPREISAKACRLLGRLHHQSPRIPLILGWPSNKKSIVYLRQADSLAPGSPTTLLFLAEVLIDEGQKAEAMTVLEKGAALPRRPGSALEDSSDQEKCRRLLEKIKR